MTAFRYSALPPIRRRLIANGRLAIGYRRSPSNR